jgi:hypothetical protein
MRVKLVIRMTIDGASVSRVITTTSWIATPTSPGLPVPSSPMFNRSGLDPVPEFGGGSAIDAPGGACTEGVALAGGVPAAMGAGSTTGV